MSEMRDATRRYPRLGNSFLVHGPLIKCETNRLAFLTILGRSMELQRSKWKRAK